MPIQCGDARLQKVSLVTNRPAQQVGRQALLLWHAVGHKQFNPQRYPQKLWTIWEATQAEAISTCRCMCWTNSMWLGPERPVGMMTVFCSLMTDAI